MTFAEVRKANVLQSATGTIGIVIAVLAMAALLVPLSAGSESGYMLLPWIVALVACAAPFLPQWSFDVSLPRAWLREHVWDILIVVSLSVLFIALVLYDIGHWYYSVIGDEFLFYEHAKHMTEEGISRPFSQEGVYGKHPVMSTITQATVMKMLGVDYFGWTFSEALNVIITIPGLYLLGYSIGGRKAAVVSAALFSVSHVMLAFSHVGYNNLTAIPVAVWSVALFVMGWRRGNPLLLYAAGIIVGLGFYTQYSGRAMLPVIGLFALTAAGPRRLLDLWPLVLGFVVTVAPTFLVEQEQLFTRSFNQVVGGYSEAVVGGAGDRILNNLEVNVPSFHYNSTVHTYVYGSLMDPVSAILAGLGIAYALGHVRVPALRLLLIWFGVAVLITGLMSPYPHVAITRLSFVLPPLALLAGVLAGQIGDAVSSRAAVISHQVSRILAPSALALLLVAVLALNLWQFWHKTPTVYPHKPEAVALGAFRSGHCAEDTQGTVLVGVATDDGSLTQKMWASIYTDWPLPRRLNHDQIAPDAEGFDPPPRCVIFVNPTEPESSALRERLTYLYPDGQTVNFSNPSGTTTVAIFARPQN